LDLRQRRQQDSRLLIVVRKALELIADTAWQRACVDGEVHERAPSRVDAVRNDIPAPVLKS
jgi:hypothetical protein